jgi:hypothetical protein
MEPAPACAGNSRILVRLVRWDQVGIGSPSSSWRDRFAIMICYKLFRVEVGQ